MTPTRCLAAPLAAVVLCLAVAMLPAARTSAAAPAIRSRVPANPPGLPGDFNGDGEADLAVGVPGEDMGTVTDAGAVNVVYGSGAGLLSDGNQFWNQDSPGILDQAEAGDRFGSAVAVGDFDGDGFSDLAIGIPGESVGSNAGAGAVAVLYGAIGSGLGSDRNQLWTQDSSGVPGHAEPGDAFGSALAVGDFNGDGFADLAVGVPGEDDGGGAIDVLYGSAGGLTGTGSQLWNQEQPGVLGTKSAHDQFGFALAAGDFGGDGKSDLAVGVPYDDEAGPKNAGVVNVLLGSAAGLSASGNQLWTQDSSGVLDQAEQGDDFGYALASTDFGTDGYADLAVGVSKEDLTGAKDAGGVNVLYGSAGGLSSTGNQFWAQGQDGLLGTASAGDRFGFALAAAEFGNAVDVTAGDLAIGVPFDDEAGKTDAGAVNVIYGTATGLASDLNQLWTRKGPLVPGDPEVGDQFGVALGAGEFGNGPRTDLAIGVAFDDVTGPGNDEGSVNVLYAFVHGGLTTTGAQLWNQDSTGILDSSEQGDTFGSSAS